MQSVWVQMECLQEHQLIYLTIKVSRKGFKLKTASSQHQTQWIIFNRAVSISLDQIRKCNNCNKQLLLIKFPNKSRLINKVNLLRNSCHRASNNRIRIKRASLRTQAKTIRNKQPNHQVSKHSNYHHNHSSNRGRSNNPLKFLLGLVTLRCNKTKISLSLTNRGHSSSNLHSNSNSNSSNNSSRLRRAM